MSSAVSVDEDNEDWEQRKQERKLHIFKMRARLDHAEDIWSLFLNKVEGGQLTLMDKVFECNQRCLEIKELIDELESQYSAIYGEKL